MKNFLKKLFNIPDIEALRTRIAELECDREEVLHNYETLKRRYARLELRNIELQRAMWRMTEKKPHV
jgi:hypothetical protein